MTDDKSGKDDGRDMLTVMLMARDREVAETATKNFAAMVGRFLATTSTAEEGARYEAYWAEAFEGILPGRGLAAWVHHVFARARASREAA